MRIVPPAPSSIATTCTIAPKGAAKSHLSKAGDVPQTPPCIRFMGTIFSCPELCGVGTFLRKSGLFQFQNLGRATGTEVLCTWLKCSFEWKSGFATVQVKSRDELPLYLGQRHH